jgi:hypothetical protein
MRKAAGVLVTAAALGLGLGIAPAAQAAAPGHGGSWVAGHFPGYRACQAAGYQGQRQHRWNHFNCGQTGGRHDDHHGKGRHDGRGTVYVLNVRR